MLKIFKNPLSLWVVRLLGSCYLEIKYKRKNLKINGSSSIKKCRFGNRNTIYKNVQMNEVDLGDFTYIAVGSNLSRVSIGKFCSIGPASKIGIGKHPSDTFVSTHPIFFSTIKQSQITFSDKNYFTESVNITIGNDVWIGAGVIVVDGVNIADGVIVAAGSVVTKDVPPYAIVGGVPAKIIKYRFKKNEIEELLKLKWWDMDIDYLRRNYKKFHNIKNFTNL